MMKIIVCVKQIAHIYIQNGFDAATRDIVAKGLVHVINPYDEVAVEEGIRLKERYGGKVTVITMGPEEAEAVLRWCLAMGADNACHVVAGSGKDPDPWRTASSLANVIKKHDADILLFGKKALDDELGLIGIFVAELLNLPVVSSVAKIESVDKEKAVVLRALERGNRERAVCRIPAVLTVDKSLNRPRYPTFPARKAAKSMHIEKIIAPVSGDVFDDLKIETVRMAPPKLRPKKILSPDSSLSAAARINFVMTGGMGAKKGGAISGDPKQMVAGIIDFLKEKQIIS